MNNTKWNYTSSNMEHEFNFDIDKTIIGLPGTGKTTTLQKDILRSLKNQGYGFNDIAVGTFTNTMVDEFQEKAREEFVIEEDLNWFETTNALALKLLAMNGHDWEEIITADQKKEFCDFIGIPFSKSAEYDDSGTEQKKKGNVLFDLREYCFHTLKNPINDWREAYREIKPEPSINSRMVQKFNKELVDWKKEKEYLSFVDMIRICVENNYCLPCDVLIDDEFQDKSILELKLFEQWSNSVEKTFVAGDPFQAIYQFKGTDPDYMFEAYKQADEGVILDNTYRFGEDLWDFSKNILQGSGYDVPEIGCTGQTKVEFISWREYMSKVKEHQSDNCFHLSRSKHLYDDIEEILMNSAVISRKDFGENDWDNIAYQNYFDNVLHAVDIAENIKGTLTGFGDRTIPPKRVDYLIKMAPNSIFKEDKSKIKKTIKTKKKTGTDFKMNEVFDRENFVEVFYSDNPFNSLNETRYSDWYKHRSTLSEAFVNGNELSEHVSHEITTIHKSKGMDSDYVFLLNGSTKKIKRDSSRKSEARVFFVGATRAKKKLYVVDTQENYKFRMR